MDVVDGQACGDQVEAGGQAAVLTDPTVVTDYYRAVSFDTPPPADHIDIRGNTRYLQISFGHRIMYAKADDAQIVPAP